MIFRAWLMDVSQVAVGVGALAGSTIMLLTIPWSLAILGGRVDMIKGRPVYKKVRPCLSLHAPTALS